MIKKVVFCSLRDNKGATGGPGGVLYMQKITIGSQINGIPCKYRFNFVKSGKRWRNMINILLFYVLTLFDRDTYYVTHDIRSAQIFASMRKRYSLVYHQQGPRIYESIMLGGNLSESKKIKIRNTERYAFIHAKSLHFPSKGAEDMYFKNELRACERNEVNIGEPLYNTIPDSLITPIEGVEKDSSSQTFFSLGTLTKSKGQDQVVLFLESYLAIYNKPVRYFIVGKGPLRDELIESLDTLSTKYSHFSYTYYERLSHDEVMYLHHISDIYIMLHRLSIFDFATLEAMAQKTAVVLSPVGGNVDFNKNKNVIFVENNYSTAAEELKNADIENLKILNKKVFEEYFSTNAFRSEYVHLISNS